MKKELNDLFIEKEKYKREGNSNSRLQKQEFISIAKAILIVSENFSEFDEDELSLINWAKEYLQQK